MKTVEGQNPEFVAPVPVCAVKSATLSFDTDDMEEVKTIPTDTVSVVAYEVTARMYVVPPTHRASSEIWFAPPGSAKGKTRNQFPPPRAYRHVIMYVFAPAVPVVSPLDIKSNFKT